MKRLIPVAVVLAGFVGGGLALSANAAVPEEPHKVFVCKYVGTPGVDERLQTGQNPISVDIHSLDSPPVIGAFFTDAQGRSVVIAFDTGQPEPPVTACPTVLPPPPPPTTAPPTTAPPTTAPPTTAPPTTAPPTTTPTTPSTTPGTTPRTTPRTPATTKPKGTTPTSPPRTRFIPPTPVVIPPTLTG